MIKCTSKGRKKSFYCSSLFVFFAQQCFLFFRTFIVIPHSFLLHPQPLWLTFSARARTHRPYERRELAASRSESTTMWVLKRFFAELNWASGWRGENESDSSSSTIRKFKGKKGIVKLHLLSALIMSDSLQPFLLLENEHTKSENWDEKERKLHELFRAHCTLRCVAICSFHLAIRLFVFR